MKIFLDTANVYEIERLAKTGLINGVTTNPTHLSKEAGNPTHTVKDICRLLPRGEISVEVTEEKPELVYKQARALARLSKNVLVKVPCHRDYYEVINKLAKDKIPLNITLVFTVLQGLMMAKLGVKYISPFIGRWDDIDADGGEILYEMRSMLDTYGFRTELLAASIRGVRNFHDAVLAGSDAVTVPIDVFDKATEHILTNQGIQKFNNDWKKLKVKTFPL